MKEKGKERNMKTKKRERGSKRKRESMANSNEITRIEMAKKPFMYNLNGFSSL